MDAWNSVVFVRAKSMPDKAAMKKMMGVEKMWSTSGDWDWCIQLDAKHSTPEQTEMFVSQLRNSPWVAETKTNWWKQVKMM